MVALTVVCAQMKKSEISSNQKRLNQLKIAEANKEDNTQRVSPRGSLKPFPLSARNTSKSPGLIQEDSDATNTNSNTGSNISPM